MNSEQSSLTVPHRRSPIAAHEVQAPASEAGKEVGKEAIRPLEQFLGPGAAQAPENWLQQPLVYHASLQRLPADLLTGSLSSFERLCSVYRGPVKLAAGKGRGFYQLPASPDASPWKLRRMGHTVSLTDVRPFVPELGPWIDQLARDMGLPAKRIRVCAFASPAGGGLPYHFDPDDVAILHLSGEKELHLATTRPEPDPVTSYTIGFIPTPEDFALFRGGFRKRPPPASVIQMQPGSVVFFPSGYWHHTVTHSDTFSISVIFEWPKAIDLMLSRLRTRLIEDSEWRRPMRGAWTAPGQAAARREIGDLLTKLPSQLSDLDADSILRQVDGHIEGLFRYVRASTAFVRVPTISMVIDRKDGKSAVRISAENFQWDGLFRIPEHLTNPSVWIARQRTRFTPHELADRFKLDIQESIALLRGLTRGGAIRPDGASSDVWDKMT